MELWQSSIMLLSQFSFLFFICSWFLHKWDWGSFFFQDCMILPGWMKLEKNSPDKPNINKFELVYVWLCNVYSGSCCKLAVHVWMFLTFFTSQLYLLSIFSRPLLSICFRPCSTAATTSTTASQTWTSWGRGRGATRVKTWWSPFWTMGLSGPTRTFLRTTWVCMYARVGRLWAAVCLCLVLSVTSKCWSL